MKFVLTTLLTLLVSGEEECLGKQEDTAAMIQSREHTRISTRKGDADLESILSDLSDGDADIFDEGGAALVDKAALLLRATQPISVQFDTLPDDTKTKLVKAARRLQSSVQAAPELADIFEGREEELIKAAALLEEQASETPGLGGLMQTASMLQQGKSVDQAMTGKGKVNLDGASLNKYGCNGCKCIDPQGTGKNDVPFNRTEYLRASWFVQRQQVNGYQPRNKLYCVVATYNETFRGKKLKLAGGGAKGGYFHAFNNGNAGQTNGKSLEAHASPKFKPSFGTPLCARNYQKDIPSAAKVAPCGLPKSFSGDYWVVNAGPAQDNYEWAIISAGQPTVKLSDGCTTPTTCSGPAQAQCGLWLITRDPVPDAATMTALTDAAKSQGISLQKVVTVDHSDCGYDNYFIKPNVRKNIVEVAQSVPEASTLVTAVVAAGLVDLLQGPGPTGAGFTVFAPSNDAFAALSAGALDTLLQPESKADLVSLLSYHVVSGYRTSKFLSLNNGEQLETLEGRKITVTVDNGAVKLGSAGVLVADVQASNGLIHLVDSVLEIPPNLVQVAQSVGDLSTLVAAVIAADLVDTFSEPSATYTLFAPTNAAFASLADGVLDDLLKPENKADLVKILTYHALDSTVMSTDIKVNNRRRNKFKTVARQYVTVVKAENGTVTVNDATVVTPDVGASNGVAHVIDAVLLPK